jgi:hypothetical protein
MPYPKIDLGASGVFADNEYRDGTGNVWVVPRLAELAKKLEPFDLPLCGVDLSTKIFRPVECAFLMAYHLKRVQDTSLEHPVILDQYGMIMDGWHRVVKAILEGRETIKAVRFEKTPKADYKEAGK